MLSRAYLLFTGILLLVLGIAGYMSPTAIGATTLPGWMPVAWGVSGLLALLLGFVSRNINTLRAFSVLYGGVYLLWGLAAIFVPVQAAQFADGSLVNLLHVMIGALGLAAALAPATWLRESGTHAPSRAT